MNKRILISLSVIGAVAAIAVGGTIAYFSDTETSTGNTFTAGSLDLKVDSTCHYWQNGVDIDCGAGEAYGNWTETDLGPSYKFFNFGDVKPGDSGENTISIHPVDNDANICAYVTSLVNQENGCNEPEGKVDTGTNECDNPGVGYGELQDNILFTVWRDNGGNNPHTPADLCDNELDPQEHVYVTDAVLDNNSGVWDLGQIKGDSNTCLGVSWKVLSGVGNIIQGDSVSANVIFYAEQVRNNPNFTCPTSLPVEPIVP
jgi:predicted ribosomally synthesized peptide with SipW-like signal peptide